jgi:hypothetical protein
MKIKRLLLQPPDEYQLLGIIGPARDFKMAWSVNNALHVKLSKADPIEYRVKGEHSYWLHHFIFKTENGFLRLIPNRIERISGQDFLYLLPEFKRVDYFLQIEDPGMSFDVDAIVTKLKFLEIVQYIVKIEDLKPKTRDILAF